MNYQPLIDANTKQAKLYLWCFGTCLWCCVCLMYLHYVENKTLFEFVMCFAFLAGDTGNAFREANERRKKYLDLQEGGGS